MANQVVTIADLARATNSGYYIRSLSNTPAFSYDMVGKTLRVVGGGFPDTLLFINDYTVADLGDGGSFAYYGLVQQVDPGATGGNGTIIVGERAVDGKRGKNFTATPYGPYFLYDPDSNLSPDDVGLQVTLSANSTTEGLSVAGDYWIVEATEDQLAGPFGQKYPYFTLASVSDNTSPPGTNLMRGVSWELKEGVGARLPVNAPDYSVTWRRKVLMIGDSRTYGLGNDTNTPGDPTNHNPGNRYRDALREMFPNSTIEDTDIVNVGVRGSTSTQWRQGTANYNAAIAALQAMGDPDAVDIDLGMNQGDGQTIEEYIDDLQSLCGGIRALYPDIIIILNEPAWTWDPGRDPSWNEACKNALHLVGNRTVLGTMEEQAHSKATKGLQPDLVHSNTAGQIRDARFRVRGIAPYLNGTKTIPPAGGGTSEPVDYDEIQARVTAAMIDLGYTDTRAGQIATAATQSTAANTKLGTPANEDFAADIAEVNDRAIIVQARVTTALPNAAPGAENGLSRVADLPEGGSGDIVVLRQVRRTGDYPQSAPLGSERMTAGDTNDAISHRLIGEDGVPVMLTGNETCVFTMKPQSGGVAVIDGEAATLSATDGDGVRTVEFLFSSQTPVPPAGDYWITWQVDGLTYPLGRRIPVRVQEAL